MKNQTIFLANPVVCNGENMPLITLNNPIHFSDHILCKIELGGYSKKQL